MLSIKKITKNVVAISTLIVIAGAVLSCGKKSGGGGASAPATCDVNGTCTVGQNYASGVYFRTGIGQARYGNYQNMVMKLAFYGKNGAGLVATTNPVTYSGLFDVTGTVRLGDGAYTGVSKTLDRKVSNFSVSINAGVALPSFQIGGSVNGGARYSLDGRNTYYLPCGYNNPNCDRGFIPQRPITCLPNVVGCNNPNTGYNNIQCQIPVGDYTVTTIQSGNYVSGNTYNTYYNSESFTGLKIRFQSGANVVDASFYQGTLQANNGTSHILRGSMVVTSVNNQQCNQTVQF